MCDFKMILVKKVDYFGDDNIVFGVYLNGEVKVYFKCILVWYEMVVDSVGGVDFVGVYCMLCGVMIFYKIDFNGINYELGMSGFFYWFNKFMYDVVI